MRNRAALKGSVGVSHLMVVGLVALVGAGAMGGLGGAFDTAIGSDADGGVPVSVQAAGAAVLPAEAEVSPGDANAFAEPVVVSAGSAQAGGGAPGPGVADLYEDAVAESEGCGWSPACHLNVASDFFESLPVAGTAFRFATNFGLNPVEWLVNPHGSVVSLANRAFGVGQFAWGLGSAALNLGYRALDLTHPAFVLEELLTEGPREFFDRRFGIASEAWRLGSGVLEFSARSSGVAIALACATGGASGCSDYLNNLRDEGWNNPVVQAIVADWGECAGETGSAASQNACGRVTGDVLLTLLTSGSSKGLTTPRYADEGLDASRVIDGAEDAAGAERHLDDLTELDDAGRASDPLVRTETPAEIAARTEAYANNCLRGTCTQAAARNYLSAALSDLDPSIVIIQNADSTAAHAVTVVQTAEGTRYLSWGNVYDDLGDIAARAGWSDHSVRGEYDLVDFLDETARTRQNPLELPAEVAGTDAAFLRTSQADPVSDVIPVYYPQVTEQAVELAVEGWADGSRGIIRATNTSGDNVILHVSNENGRVIVNGMDITTRPFWDLTSVQIQLVP